MDTPFPFYIKQRVYFEDTDMFGVVYHTNYIKYMERARSEWFWVHQLSFNEFMKQGIAFAVHHIDINYRKPAHLKDTLLCTCSIASHTKSAIVFDQSVINADNSDIIYADAKIRIVCMTLEGRPYPIPKELLEIVI